MPDRPLDIFRGLSSNDFRAPGADSLLLRSEVDRRSLSGCAGGESHN